MISIKTLENACDSLEKEWKSKDNLINKIQKKKYKQFGLTKWRAEFDRIYEEMEHSGNIDYSTIPAMPIHSGRLLHKNPIEYALFEIEIAELENETSKLVDKINAKLRPNRENTTFKKISKKEQRALESETCAICYEEHNISQIVTIGSCGHSFGKQCFTGIINHCYYHYQDIKCPCCRNPTIDMIRYRK